jgi:hypothetical protein
MYLCICNTRRSTVMLCIYVPEHHCHHYCGKAGLHTRPPPQHNRCSTHLYITFAIQTFVFCYEVANCVFLRGQGRGVVTVVTCGARE